MEIFLTIVLSVMTLLTFCLYGLDKRRAMQGAWRISEKVLLGCSVCGGAAGGLLAMYAFRHKTKHGYFCVVNLLFALAYVGLLAFVWGKKLGAW